MAIGVLSVTDWRMNLGYALNGPAITVSPVDYDAGDLTRVKEDVLKTFKVSNTGDALLSISKIKYT